MKLRAVGNYLLIRIDHDSITEKTKSDIVLPDGYVKRLKGGCQVSTVLSVGDSAFDDKPPQMREQVVPGVKIIHGRYPGHAIDINADQSDEDANRFRVISDEEVHAIESEDGVEIGV